MKLTEELKQRIDAFIESKSAEELESILDKYELNSKDSNKKEFKVGEEFQCGFVKLRCEKGYCCSCYNCYFYFKNKENCHEFFDFTGSCYASDREDKQDVIFVKVEDTE